MKINFSIQKFFLCFFFQSRRKFKGRNDAEVAKPSEPTNVRTRTTAAATFSAFDDSATKKDQKAGPRSVRAGDHQPIRLKLPKSRRRRLRIGFADESLGRLHRPGQRARHFVLEERQLGKLEGLRRSKNHRDELFSQRLQ